MSIHAKQHNHRFRKQIVIIKGEEVGKFWLEIKR